MEHDPVSTPEIPEAAPVALAQAEQRLNALADRLARQLEESAQQDAQRQEALDAREENLNQRELKAKARDALQRHGLPADLADCLAFDTEQGLEAGVALLEQAFRAAVQQGVEERLLTDAPKSASLTPLSQLSDEEYYAAVCRND